MGTVLSVGLMGGEPVLPRPSFERIGILERDSRTFCGVVGSRDERRWGMDGREFGIVDYFGQYCIRTGCTYLSDRVVKGDR
jgi:hypothetical protein